MIEPHKMKDLEDPAFVRHLQDSVHGGKIEPDNEDFDPLAPCGTKEEAAAAYRVAQAKKLMRMWGEWKAKQN